MELIPYFLLNHFSKIHLGLGTAVVLVILIFFASLLYIAREKRKELEEIKKDNKFICLNLFLDGYSSEKWLYRTTSLEIISYLEYNSVFDYHPGLISLICQHNFTNQKDIIIVCERFTRYLSIFGQILDKYQGNQSFYISALMPIASFLEASNYSLSLNELIKTRGLLLEIGYTPRSKQLIALNYAIEGLRDVKNSK